MIVASIAAFIAGFSYQVVGEANDDSLTPPSVVASSLMFLNCYGNNLEFGDLETNFDATARLHKLEGVNAQVLKEVLRRYNSRVISKSTNQFPAKMLPVPSLISFDTGRVVRLFFAESHEAGGIWLIDYYEGQLKRFHVKYSLWSPENESRVFFVPSTIESLAVTFVPIAIIVISLGAVCFVNLARKKK